MNMKFRDPKTGKVYPSWTGIPCPENICENCPASSANNKRKLQCMEFGKKFPEEAAKSIGLEVVYEPGEEPAGTADESKGDTMPDTSRKGILEAARRCVCGDRDEDYGSPEDSFETIGLLWGAYLKASYPDQLKTFPRNGIEPKDVAAMMALLKIARVAAGHGKADNWVDLAGYAACGGEIEGGKS